MNIHNNINEIKTTGFVATIGIFDGVHIAHQSIINKMNQLAGTKGKESMVITLWPHPRFVLKKNHRELELLTTIDEKIRLLKKSGVQNLFIIPFTKEFAATPYNDFITNYLINGLKISALVTGFDNQFGRNREGNFDKLVEITNKHHIDLIKIEPYTSNGKKISSTLIRENIKQGNLPLANQLLGYQFSLKGPVFEGEKLGRTIGFPTANIQIKDQFKIMPKNGVYASMVQVNNKLHPGLLNIGVRPTISDSNNKTVEVHILNFNGNLYNQYIQVYLLERVRDEQRFKSLNDLKVQIEIDKENIIDIIQKKYT